MIPKRIIPTFLLKGKRLVKGTRFNDFVDVGDPLSQAMIYDAQGAEELVMVDIEASRRKGLIDTQIIKRSITRCRLPIAAGGGIKTLKDAGKCFAAGADKIVVNTHAVLNPYFVKQLSKEFGSQSVLISIDVRRNVYGRYDIFVFSARVRISKGLLDLIKQFRDYGAGEIVITSMEREGTLSGFDINLYRMVRPIMTMPLIASGGAGSYDDIVSLFQETQADACALGKMLFLRDYDIVRIKSYLKGRKIPVREA